MQLDPQWTAIAITAAMFGIVFLRELRLWLRDWRIDAAGEGEKDASVAKSLEEHATHLQNHAAQLTADRAAAVNGFNDAHGRIEEAQRRVFERLDEERERRHAAEKKVGADIASIKTSLGSMTTDMHDMKQKVDHLANGHIGGLAPRQRKRGGLS